MTAGRAFLILAGLWASAPALGAEGDDEVPAAARDAAMKTFKDQVAPFITAYCLRCHGEHKQKAGVRFDYAVKTPAVPSFRSLWMKAVANVKSHDMPPPGDGKQPTDEQRRAVADWVTGLKYLSPKDPGEFVIRRLTKVELGNTLRDLFGVDPRVVGDLPDEVFGAGYTNSVSPLLLEQVLAIASDVVARIPAAALEGLFGPPGADPRAATRQVARRAYRRPPTEAELDVLGKV